MIRHLGLATGLLVLCTSAIAQPYQIGWRDMAFPNSSNSGSAILQCRVFYPASIAGMDTPIVQRTGGHPVVVFLHGLGSLGRNFTDVYNPLAANGYVAVMSDTAQFDWTLQVQDGLALYPMLVQENLNPASPFVGALDMTRASVHGYSMGGGSAMRVLMTNPGYRAGFCHAPALYAGAHAQDILVPFGIVHGMGDTVVPPDVSATYVRDAYNFTGIKFRYLLNQDADHNNIVVIGQGGQIDRDVVARVQQVFLGFYDAVLKENPVGCDRCVGTTARAEPRFVPSGLLVGIEQPELWVEGSGKIGSPLRISELCEPGLAVWMMSPGRGSLNTPIGTLLLDTNALAFLPLPSVNPLTRLAVLDTFVPALPGLVGYTFTFQATGITSANGPRLTGACDLKIVP